MHEECPAFVLYADTPLSINQIALLLSPCYTTLHDRIRELEIAFCRGFPTVWERAAAQDLLEGEMSQVEIAEKHGVTPSAISNGSQRSKRRD